MAVASNIGKRIDFLRTTQNPDGGWGYFPGKQSWLEPTAWAALALHSQDPERAAKAWTLIQSWRNPDGSSRPSAAVALPNWTSALTVAMGALRKDREAVQPGLRYLLTTTGEDSTTLARIAKTISPNHTDREPKFKGWPWRPGNHSWIEPTAHGVTALRLASRAFGNSAEIDERIDSAQRMILNQRCADGGWNYGARSALGVALESFPETTALALIGLAGRRGIDGAIAHAEKLAAQRQSPLAAAWLSIALGLHGRTPAVHEPSELRPDILLTAIEALDWRLLAA